MVSLRSADVWKCEMANNRSKRTGRMLGFKKSPNAIKLGISGLRTYSNPLIQPNLHIIMCLDPSYLTYVWYVHMYCYGCT